MDSTFTAEKPKCPSCQAGLENEQAVCPSCGSELRWIASSARQRPEAVGLGGTRFGVTNVLIGCLIVVAVMTAFLFTVLP